MGDCTEVVTLQPGQSWKYMGRGRSGLQSGCKVPWRKFDMLEGRRSQESNGQVRNKGSENRQDPRKRIFILTAMADTGICKEKCGMI